MKKKVYKMLFLLLCFTLCVLLFIGCKVERPDDLPYPPEYEEKEVGDYIVFFYDNYCEIAGTTEQGKNKKYLVIPEQIEGVEVRSFGAYNQLHELNVLETELLCPEIKSDVLEKIYFQSPISSFPQIDWGDCPNLEKVMYPTIGDPIQNRDVYYPSKIYDIGVQNGEINPLLEEPHKANVSYSYNYDTSKNNGYYLIDDCDYGSTIEFIPPDPERDDYVFGGWYKEPECINEWDFETDTLPEEKKEMGEAYKNGEFFVEEIQVYQETVLYAKWTLKS